MFPKLQKLILESLPNLKAFCQGSYNFEFPSLREVKIVDCPNIEAFSRGSTHAPLNCGLSYSFILDNLHNVLMGNRLSNSTGIKVQNGDLNAVTDGFKALVALQASDMMRWSDFYNRGILKISRIIIDEFHKLLMLVPFKEIHMLQHVKELIIRNCKSLNEVFESEGGMRCSKEGYGTIRYELQILYLIGLPKLRCIWGPNTMRHVGFDKLTSIQIIGCDSLKSLVSYSMARSLVQLSSLEVGKSEMIEEIVSKEDNNSNSGGKVKTLFPKLEKLYLYNLPKLTSVCSGDYDYDIPLCDENNDKEKQVQISFPLLNYFYLSDVPRLKCFCSGAYDYHLMLSTSSSSSSPCIDIEKSTQVVTTPNLHEMSVDNEDYLIRTEGDLNLTINCIHNSKKYKEELQKLETLASIEQHQYQHLRAYITRVTKLELDSCHKLLSCFPSNLMQLFKHLKRLRVQQCGLLEEIFESNNDCAETMELDIIVLHSLPKLKHIWRNNQGSLSGFQNITSLSIKECHHLKFVFPNVSAAGSLPNLGWLEVHKCNKMEEIISSNDNNDNSIPRRAKIIFRSLRYIELKELPELKCFCSSSFYFELPDCGLIIIEECPKMENFCYGTLYTPNYSSFNIEGTHFDGELELNEILQEIKEHNKYNL